MNGILILAHGSRRQEADQPLKSLIQQVKDKTGEQLIYSAYLQFSEPDLEAGIAYLIAKGADKIKVIPLFLFDGTHVNLDIPQQLQLLRDKHPGIEVKMSRHLGDDERIADIIVDRITSIA